MYSSAENAYAAFDFTGLGYITADRFLESYLVRDRIRFSHEDMQDFFSQYNLFSETSKGINFDSFKKFFFPHLYLVQEDKDDIDDIHAKEIRN